MSIIEINSVGYTEENFKNNWSADYATRFDSFTGYIDFVTNPHNLK